MTHLFKKAALFAVVVSLVPASAVNVKDVLGSVDNGLRALSYKTKKGQALIVTAAVLHIATHGYASKVAKGFGAAKPLAKATFVGRNLLTGLDPRKVMLLGALKAEVAEPAETAQIKVGEALPVGVDLAALKLDKTFEVVSGLVALVKDGKAPKGYVDATGLTVTTVPATYKPRNRLEMAKGTSTVVTYVTAGLNLYEAVRSAMEARAAAKKA